MRAYSRLNDPKMYRNRELEEREIPVPKEAVFAMKGDEIIQHTFPKFHRVLIGWIRGVVDGTDLAMVEEIARSKYLTSLQIYEYLNLRGYHVSRAKIRKRILKLMRARVVQENELICPDRVHSIRYYELDVNGYLFAREQGVCFHMGNRYLSFQKKRELGVVVHARDIKRIIVGNQIVLGLLLGCVKMERFGIMETLCVDTDQFNLNDSIIRTAAVVRLDGGNVLAYEVVRDYPGAYVKLVDKVSRYYTILSNQDYLAGNKHGDVVYPQMVICGESSEHNFKIAQYLKEEGLWNLEKKILFTEDLLNMRDSSRSIYEIAENNTICWHRLTREDHGRIAADRYSA